MISFNAIPADLRVPGVYVEFDPSKALSGLPAAANKMLLIGQKLATGTVAALTPTRIVKVEQATAAFGRASMLDRMVRFAKAADSETEMWVVALDDLNAGAAATGTITFNGNAAAAGTLPLMIAGQRVPVAIAAGQTGAQSGVATAVAINAQPDLPVTAAANGAGIVTLTARHKGTSGNDLDIRLAYYQGDVVPPNTGVTIVPMSGGAGNPDVTTALAAIGEGETYRTVIMGMTDVANVAAVEVELEARWGPLRMIDGTLYVGMRGSQGACAAIGAARNSSHSSIIGANKSPNPPYEWAASYGAAVGYASAIDPARPSRTLPLPGILPPAIGDRFTRPERELLLRDGISTFTVDQGGTVLIERAISTYQTDAFGIDSIVWLDLATPHTLAYLRYTARAYFSQRYPRHKLAGDDANYAPGQAIVTPRVIRAEWLVLFRAWERAGLVEDFAQFERDLIVERDAADKTRLNCLVAPNIVNPLHTLAVRIEFRL